MKIVEVFATSWIEIERDGHRRIHSTVEVFATSWIEIHLGVLSGILWTSRSLRPRGLKYQKQILWDIRRLVEVFATSWIEMTADKTWTLKATDVEVFATSWIEI